ncbi:hypothetical protein C900_04073 [Fulvivirga imtechensis AK7]|uniref:Uncharacterized protein n=1 Tax=Fulvivirga imtechensis AK7 TaxID=1237149 RepID=L8JMC2_9BACT|nr:hypothetical protein [Fulvivirga imtechensis]ELR70076.1 hypothetical protein C900_04073 [Fulvivirga imtechensis AK7]
MLKLNIQNELKDENKIIQANKEIIEVLWLIEDVEYLHYLDDDIMIIIKVEEEYPPIRIEILTKNHELAATFKKRLKRFMPT